MFVFGPNGRGKSSVIEAIRWCLFGSQAGKEIEVRNTYYEKADCVVAILLSGDEGTVQLKREMRPGADRSRLTVRNSAGNESTLQETLPELARIGHEQGTQVIFAAQQSAGRQATVDIADFTQILCFYLHLEDAPELVRRLRKVIEERSVAADRMALELSVAEDQFRDLLKQLQFQQNAIFSNPPWGEGPAPTGDETERKIALLLTEHARLNGASTPLLAGRAALAEVRRLIDACDAQSNEAKHQRLAMLVTSLPVGRTLLENLRNAVARVSSLRVECEANCASLLELQSGGTAEALRAEAQRIERSMSVRERRVEIARLAEALCIDNSLSTCPLCDTSVVVEELSRIIAARIGEPNGSAEEAERLSEINAKIREADRLQAEIETVSASLSEAEATELEAIAAVGNFASLEPSWDALEFETFLQTMATDIESLSRDIAESTAERQHRLKVAKELEIELTYHECRDRIDQTQHSLGPSLDPARGVLAAYRDLLRSISSIAELVDGAFNESLDRIVPELNGLLTEVYARLTRQVSYDEVKITRASSPPHRRELRVASSRRPGQTFPPNVLNGQAAKALQLVPYFVFSRFQPEVMELDLLLIDDPSESFDTSHVESLVAELSDAAKHAQLVVATHEREKFQSHVENMFPAATVRIASVERFDLSEGPTIECR